MIFFQWTHVSIFKEGKIATSAYIWVVLQAADQKNLFLLPMSCFI